MFYVELKDMKDEAIIKAYKSAKRHVHNLEDSFAQLEKDYNNKKKEITTAKQERDALENEMIGRSLPLSVTLCVKEF